ncbi:hypothetical protein [Clostridium sp. ZS2-4]|uniref:hypothetical protein n=1 Tax=Clostridium sp. ZS2-4 TaxID=2987703 RepID=UPI00227AD8DD|nr:hypothetical protein [Clostridium sp. ZS2-4]MCY6354394.1 hypothetical protein [Clostridium sp. ZS2-4]
MAKENKNLESKEFKNFGIKESKNLRSKKAKNKDSVEELSSSEVEIVKDNIAFDADGTEILMGGDIDLSNAKVEKQFSFNSNNTPVLNVNVEDEDAEKLDINSKETVEEALTVKRSYSLRPSTVKMLQELKVFIYDDPYIKYNDIVDAAIRFFYDFKKNSK